MVYGGIGCNSVVMLIKVWLCQFGLGLWVAVCSLRNGANNWIIDGECEFALWGFVMLITVCAAWRRGNGSRARGSW